MMIDTGNRFQEKTILDNLNKLQDATIALMNVDMQVIQSMTVLLGEEEITALEAVRQCDDRLRRLKHILFRISIGSKRCQ